MTRTALRTNRALQATYGWVRGVHDGIVLGMASEAFLDALDHEYYETTQSYRDAGYNTSGLLPWEQQTVANHFPDSGRICVVGVGGGREAFALADKGYTVEAYDPNEPLILEARSIRPPSCQVRFDVLERCAVPSTLAGCNALILGWGVYHSVRSERGRIALLEEANEMLPTGSPVLLSFQTRARGGSIHHRTTYRLASAGRSLRRLPRPQYGDMIAPVFVHQFSPGEIRMEIEAAGLDLLELGDWGYGWAVARTNRKQPNG